VALRRLHLLRSFPPHASRVADKGAGFDFPAWRAYTQPVDGQILVILDRVRLARGEHLEPAGDRCTMCYLPLRRIDDTHEFCTAGCDARAVTAGVRTPARSLPDDGIVERRHEVRGRYDAHPVQPIAECLTEARRLAKERNVEERANSEHLADLFEQARALQSPDARAGMAGACWVSLELDGNAEPVPTGRVTVRRTAPGRPNGIEVESWPLYAVHSSWEHIPTALDRKRDTAAIAAAAERVIELGGTDYRPRYARLRSSLASNSEAAPSSTTSPVEST
jgi:hypothetical protein